MVVTRCPTTGAAVATGITCDWETSDNLPSRPGLLHCSACEGEHAWSTDEAWLVRQTAPAE